MSRVPLESSIAEYPRSPFHKISRRVNRIGLRGAARQCSTGEVVLLPEHQASLVRIEAATGKFTAFEDENRAQLGWTTQLTWIAVRR